jgi:hypothetical protein
MHSRARLLTAVFVLFFQANKQAPREAKQISQNLFMHGLQLPKL